MHEIEVKVIFEGKEYKFDSGSKVYIFHTGIYNDIHKDYGMDELLDYVNYIYQCYIEDEWATPLSKFGDYVAENWDNVKKLGYKNVMDLFINQLY